MNQEGTADEASVNDMDSFKSILSNSRLIRVIAAALLLAVSFLPFIPDSWKLILAIVSLLLSGIDFLLDFISAILHSQYTELNPTIPAVTLLLLFSSESEAALVSILAQVLTLSYSKLEDTIRNYELKQINQYHSEIQYLIYEFLDEPSSTDLKMKDQVVQSAFPAMAGIVLAAILYVVLMPLLKHLTISASVYRAACILLMASSSTMVRSFPVIGSVAVVHCATLGLLFRRADSLELIDDAKTAVLDRDMQQRQHVELLYAESQVMEQDAFLNFVAHLVHFSSQPFANALRVLLTTTVEESVLDEFLEIPNYGIKASIKNQPVLFGNETLCEKFGYDLSGYSNRPGKGTALFLCLGDSCIGCVVFDIVADIDVNDIISSFEQCGIHCCFSDEEESQKISKKLKFSIFYPENAALCRADLNFSIDATPGEYSGCTLPDETDNIALMPYKSRRVSELALTNSILVFAAKVLVVIAAILGFCSPAIAVLVEGAAVVVTIIGSLRFSNTPLIRTKMRDSC